MLSRFISGRRRVGFNLFEIVIIGLIFTTIGASMQTKTFRLNKIVRDKIVALLTPRSVNIVTKSLNSEERLLHLKRKLVEEAQEVLETKNKSELIEELADLLEVAAACARAMDITPQEIETVRLIKNQSKGGFDKCIFIDKIVYDSNEHYYHYCLANPDKYPEIVEGE